MKKLLILFSVILLFAGCSKEGNNTAIYRVNVEQGAQVFAYGTTQEFNVTSYARVTELDITKPLGWEVTSTTQKLTITAPESAAIGIEKSGEITITAKGVDGSATPVVIEVRACMILTFEDVPQSNLAGPTAKGENLYPNYVGVDPALYTGYLDPISDFAFNTTIGGEGFASGGIALSRWNDKTTAGYLNQCSVYSGDHDQKNGGHKGSSTFAAVFAPTYGESGAYMHFDTDGTEFVVDHLYVTNSTYAALSMHQGDGYGKEFSYADQDWLKVKFIGHNAQGAETTSVDLYLADFRSLERGGIVTQWTKVDLSALGAVNKISFEISSSDNDPDWGMKTPAYFCMDNIAIRK